MSEPSRHDELEKQRDGERADALAELAAAGQSSDPPVIPAAATPAVAASAAKPVASGRAARAAKADSAEFKARAKAAQSHNFKRFLFPCMIAASALLILLGTIAAVTLPSEEDREYYGESVATRPWVKWLVLAAFPLALVLGVGAVVVYFDLKRNAPPTRPTTPRGTIPGRR